MPVLFRPFFLNPHGYAEVGSTSPCLRAHEVETRRPVAHFVSHSAEPAASHYAPSFSLFFFPAKKKGAAWREQRTPDAVPFFGLQGHLSFFFLSSAYESKAA